MALISENIQQWERVFFPVKWTRASVVVTSVSNMRRSSLLIFMSHIIISIRLCIFPFKHFNALQLKKKIPESDKQRKEIAIFKKYQRSFLQIRNEKQMIGFKFNLLCNAERSNNILDRFSVLTYPIT